MTAALQEITELIKIQNIEDQDSLNNIKQSKRFNFPYFNFNKSSICSIRVRTNVE